MTDSTSMIAEAYRNARDPWERDPSFRGYRNRLTGQVATTDYRLASRVPLCTKRDCWEPAIDGVSCAEHQPLDSIQHTMLIEATRRALGLDPA
jgi:hypothetical protein